MAACALVVHSLQNTFEPTTCLLRARISTLEVASSWPRSSSDGILYYFWRTEEAGATILLLYRASTKYTSHWLHFTFTNPMAGDLCVLLLLLRAGLQDFSPIRTTWRLTYLRCLHDAFNILCTQNIDVWQNGSQHGFLTVWKQSQILTTARFEGKENFICALFISTFWHFMWRSWLLADYSQGLVLLFHPKLQEIHKERICHYMPMSHLEWNEWIWF